MSATVPERDGTLAEIALIAASWFAITAAVPLLDRLYDFRALNPWILSYVRMILILLSTAWFIRSVEHRGLSVGFNLRFERVASSVGWAVVFFATAYLAEAVYQRLVLTPFLGSEMTASSGGEASTVPSLGARLFEYSYIVFEGIVEVLVFVGFLVDRLAKRWGWTASIVTANVVFALWHFPYLRMGWLPGFLLIGLTFVAGCVISLNYRVTGNTLSTALCHILVDSPSAVRILLGK